MIHVEVIFFGPARDFAKTDRVSLALNAGATVGDLRPALSERFPDLRGALPTSRFAVNEEFAADDAPLAAGDEVAMIPPVSGGNDDGGIWVELVRAAVPVGRVREFISGDPALGGIATFEGATRAENDARHGSLDHLYYEAYEGMARRKLAEMAREAKHRWQLGKVVIVHRLGRVGLAEVSVMVAVAAPHRAESFEACRWLMDTLKKDVPIWKKARYATGHDRWVEAEEAAGERGLA